MLGEYIIARIGRFSGAQVLLVVATVVSGAVVAVIKYERSRSPAQEEVRELTAVSLGKQDDASAEPDVVQHPGEVLHESLGTRIGPVDTLATVPVQSDSSTENNWVWCDAGSQAAERGYLDVRVPNMSPSPLVIGAN